MRRPYLIASLVLIFLLLLTGFSFAQQAKKVGGRIIVCMIQLEHADAEHLASVLEPFLSPEGSIVPYKPTNTLIIKDKPCIPISHPSDVESGDAKEQLRFDR